MKTKLLSVLLTLMLVVSCSFAFAGTSRAASASISASGITYPAHLYFGTGFVVKGRVSSGVRLTEVKVGVMTTAGKWKTGYYKRVNPKTASYDLNRLDSAVPISKLASGTYYYTVYAKNSGGRTATLLKKQFTVSYISTSGASKPTTLKKGSGFVIRGTVSSTYKLAKLHAGIRKSNGSWIDGKHFKVSPGSSKYSLSKMDSKIKFGSLAKGTYYYTVTARDAYTGAKRVINQRFTVAAAVSRSTTNTSSAGTLSAAGRTLSYKSAVISSIGRQPVSGPCGIYAMAYARTVIDGYFAHPSYAWLIRNYGLGSYCAYWSKAGGSSCYYLSARSCYKAVLTQLANGRPAIINLHNGYTGNNHYVTVIGYRAGTTYSNVSLKSFIALDPGWGVKKYLSAMPYSDSGSPQCVRF